MLRRKRAAILFMIGVGVVVLLSCGLTAGLIQARVVALPAGAFSAGPIAVAAAPINDQECHPTWEPCALNRMRPQIRPAYAIWLIVQTGSQSHQFRHFSLHIPLRQPRQ